MMSASLVIPTRGGSERLKILFEALKDQTHPDWEAIVVIDGDIDDSAAIVKKFAAQLPVHAIVFDENQGRVSALNTGFQAAKGDIIIRCDDDFEPGPDHIAAHVKAHSAKECGVIGLPLNIAPENAYMRAYGHDADARSREAAYATDPAERWRLWGGNTSVPRHLYDAVGGFDASYQGYGWEDLDFGFRLHALGVPIELCREAEVRHHMASVTARIRADRAYSSGMARHHFEELHGVGSTGTPNPQHSAWSRATGLAARTLKAPVSSRIAAGIDRALPVLPPAVGRKAVAFIVEASGEAGFRNGYAR